MQLDGFAPVDFWIIQEALIYEDLFQVSVVPSRALYAPFDSPPVRGFLPD
jgi:hypothetical protein